MHKKTGLLQAGFFWLQAASCKLQAASFKLQDKAEAHLLAACGLQLAAASSCF